MTTPAAHPAPTAACHEQPHRHGSHLSATTWQHARELAHAAAQPVPAVTVRLADAAGAVIATDLVARTALPAFDTAAMDGYAVSGGGPYRVIGRVLAGQQWPTALLPGQAISISTGAAVPAGIAAVIPVEDATIIGDSLLTPDVRPDHHIRRRGEDAAAGQMLAPAGTVLGPALLGLAASGGHDELCVRHPPTVHALLTGDELRSQGPSGDGQVRDALGPMLPSLIDRLGGQLTGVDYTADHPDDRLAGAITDLIRAGGISVIVVTGSTSVGVTDRLRSFLRDRSARSIVDTVDCRPGHPQLLAQLDARTFLVGLPGNPYAAMVGAYTLLGPLLAGLAGRPLPVLPNAPLQGQLRAGRGTRIVPVLWDGPGVIPIADSGSAFLQGAALAHALAAVPPGWHSGDIVSLVPLS